jgi:hypothetical protein
VDAVLTLVDVAAIKQTGRDRSGRVPRATIWSDFYQDKRDWAPTLVDHAEELHPTERSAEGGRDRFPSSPYMSNRVLNATADYRADDLARGGASGH